MKATKRVRMFTPVMAILGVLMTPLCSHAQSAGELRTGYEKYWKEDLVFLKKIRDEKDTHKAAVLVNQMKEEMLPKLQKQVQAAEEWKKTHSRQEVKQEQEWSAGNPLQKEVAGLQTDMMIHCSSQGGELADAFRDYMKSMATMMKRSRS